MKTLLCEARGHVLDLLEEHGYVLKGAEASLGLWDRHEKLVSENFVKAGGAAD